MAGMNASAHQHGFPRPPRPVLPHSSQNILPQLSSHDLCALLTGCSFQPFFFSLRELPPLSLCATAATMSATIGPTAAATTTMSALASNSRATQAVRSLCLVGKGCKSIAYSSPSQNKCLGLPGKKGIKKCEVPEDRPVDTPLKSYNAACSFLVQPTNPSSNSMSLLV